MAVATVPEIEEEVVLRETTKVTRRSQIVEELGDSGLLYKSGT